jgi:two-component system cell cycle sensor histidine kinase/response regulator CckA
VTVFSATGGPLADLLPFVVYANAFGPLTETVWMSPQVERLTGYRLDEWLGTPGFLERILHPDDRAAVLAEMDVSRRERRVFSRDYRVVARDGRTIWIHDESVPVVDEDGTPRRIDGYFVDITEQKELERRLVQTQGLEPVGRLAGGVAHDFNNLLTAIAGHIGLAVSGLPAQSPARRHLVEVLGTVESAKRLTRQLTHLSFGQADADELLDVPAAVRGMEPLLRQVAGGGVELALRVEAAPPTLLSLGRFERLLANLVANGRDAGARSIVVATGSAEDGAVVSVTDDGGGMDEDTRTRMFEPFFTTKPRTDGSGLGLAIVQGIVTRAGGRLNVESEPGRGTVVTIRLPA